MHERFLSTLLCTFHSLSISCTRIFRKESKNFFYFFSTFKLVFIRKINIFWAFIFMSILHVMSFSFLFIFFYSFACPVFANAASCHLKKLQLFQNKIIRMILNVIWSDFKSTIEIHNSTNIPLVSNFISRLTTNFYTKVVHHSNDLLSTLGQYNYDSLSFRVKHKLPKPRH